MKSDNATANATITTQECIDMGECQWISGRMIRVPDKFKDYSCRHAIHPSAPRQLSHQDDP